MNLYPIRTTRFGVNCPRYTPTPNASQISLYPAQWGTVSVMAPKQGVRREWLPVLPWGMGVVMLASPLSGSSH